MTGLYLLLIVIIIAAFIAIEAKDLLSSVVALGAAGLGLCMTFIVLQAPDVAITQLVVETLSLIVLVRATLRIDVTSTVSGGRFLNILIAVVFIAMFMVSVMKCLGGLHVLGHSLPEAAVQLNDNTSHGDVNLVSAVAMHYRGVDVLFEGAVLFTALLGVLTLSRKMGKRSAIQGAQKTDEQ